MLLCQNVHMSNLPTTRCPNCKRRRDTYPIRRSGGGTYRRGGRSYASSVCEECATTALAYASFHAGASSDGYSVLSLARLVERFDTDAARDAVTRYREGVAARKQADADRKARWEAQQAAERAEHAAWAAANNITV